MEWIRKIKKGIIFIIELCFILLIIGSAYLSGEVLAIFTVELRKGDLAKKLDDYTGYELPTRVYDVHGELITEFTSPVKRKLVYFNDLPTNLVNSFIVAEDIRYYQHTGIDPIGILRAFVRNYQANKIVEGGSTISQQLAKLFFTNKEKTYRRKLIETWIAYTLEKRFTKREILERYLNKIYFGHGVYGVGAAANLFFDKKVQDLTPAESAMLAAIPPNPKKYSPFENSESARTKQRLVLDKMVEAGYLKPDEAKKSYVLFWKNIKKRVAYLSDEGINTNRKDKSPYFSEYVRKIAENLIVNELKLPKDYLYTGGLKIYTTLDLEKQNYARKYLRMQLHRQDRLFQLTSRRLYNHIKHYYTDVNNFVGLAFNDPGYNFKYKQKLSNILDKISSEKDSLNLIGTNFAQNKIQKIMTEYEGTLEDEDLGNKAQGALICLDPKTGYIVAMVGGRKFTSRNQYNRAVYARRQPGSTFKAFVYGTALKMKRFHPNTIVGISVKGDSYSTLSLRQALKFSVNSVAVNIIKNIGPNRVVDFSSPMLGINSNRLPADPSLALGSGDVTPLELCRGIGVYANEGKEVIPIAITKIIDRDGLVIKDFEKDRFEENEPRQLIPAGLANLMTNLLRGVVRPGGTAARAVLGSGFYRPCAGKTGSTNNYKDAWFVGYTPNLVTAVWIGFDKGMSLGYHQFGGDVAAPVWAKFMRDAHKDLPYKNFNPPRYYIPALKSAPWVKIPEKIEEKNSTDLELNNSIFNDDSFFKIELDIPSTNSKSKNVKDPFLDQDILKEIEQKTESSMEKQVNKSNRKEIRKSLDKNHIVLDPLGPDLNTVEPQKNKHRKKVKNRQSNKQAMPQLDDFEIVVPQLDLNDFSQQKQSDKQIRFSNKKVKGSVNNKEKNEKNSKLTKNNQIDIKDEKPKNNTNSSKSIKDKKQNTKKETNKAPKKKKKKTKKKKKKKQINKKKQGNSTKSPADGLELFQ